MPIVTVELVPGRTEEQKQKLAEIMTNAMVDVVGSTRANVYVKFIEIPRDCWSLGGTLISRRGAKPKEES